MKSVNKRTLRADLPEGFFYLVLSFPVYALEHHKVNLSGAVSSITPYV